MSMEDYKKLVNRLRDEPKDSRKAVLSIYDLCIDAATAIENLSHRLDMAQCERDAVTRHMIELEQEVGELRAERDALAERNRSAYEIAWGCDIPSPTVPEYVELHEGMTRIMEALMDQQKEA